MAMTIDIASHKVGSGHPCFIIAEAGANHNGDTEAPKWPTGTRLGLNIQDRVGFLLAQIDILEQALRNRESVIPAKGSRV